MIEVAIACENQDTDGERYRVLLELVLGTEVKVFRLAEAAFSGWPSVYRLGPEFLRLASARGVRHALLAIDNDGGAKRYPEHHPTHPALPPVVDKEQLAKEGACRTCSLAAIVPAEWFGAGHHTCIAVPVQTIETWVLCIRGHHFVSPTPEQRFHRPTLKNLAFGRERTKEQERELSIAAFRSPGALDILRQRPSFQRFEACVREWLPTPSVLTGREEGPALGEVQQAVDALAEGVVE